MRLRKIPLQILLYSTLVFFKAFGLSNPITLLAQDTILSKAHASAIFQMTQHEWNKSAIDLDDKGVAETVVTSAGTYMVQLRYGNDAYLYVIPKYNSVTETPTNIKVTLIPLESFQNSDDSQMSLNSDKLVEEVISIVNI